MLPNRTDAADPYAPAAFASVLASVLRFVPLHLAAPCNMGSSGLSSLPPKSAISSSPASPTRPAPAPASNPAHLLRSSHPPRRYCRPTAPPVSSQSGRDTPLPMLSISRHHLRFCPGWHQPAPALNAAAGL